MFQFSFRTALAWLGAAAVFLSAASFAADSPFQTNSALTRRLKAIEQAHPRQARLTSLARSSEGRDVWLLELGEGPDDERALRPAMLVAAGVEGDRLIGTEYALAFAEAMLGSATGAERLKDSVVYIVPRLNPDAAERYFQSPLRETPANPAPYDDDRDGFTDEDPADDLNGDGLITMMRVEDPRGGLIAHPDDDRVMIEADPAKHESARWTLYPEGRDDDADKQYNEDGVGGVNFNNQFPFNYPWFDAQAGLYPLHENEPHALADFILNHPNIALVFTFGKNDTVLHAPPSGDPSGRREPQEKVRNDDVKYFDRLGELYRETLGANEADSAGTVAGSLADWVYFHRGRLALCAAGWSPELALAMKPEEDEPAKKEEQDKSESSGESKEEKKADSAKEKKSDEKRGATEVKYLKWLNEHGVDAFTAWTRVDDPDFPGKTVEVGGWKPYANVTPPADMLESLKQRHADYLLDLAGDLPRVEIFSAEAEPLGAGVFNLIVRVRNTGYLPTVLHHGERTDEIVPTRVEVDLPGDAFLAGQKVTRLGPIDGGEVVEARMVVKARTGASTGIRVISAMGGAVETTVTWKGE